MRDTVASRATGSVRSPPTVSARACGFQLLDRRRREASSRPYASTKSFGRLPQTSRHARPMPPSRRDRPRAERGGRRGAGGDGEHRKGGGRREAQFAARRLVSKTIVADLKRRDRRAAFRRRQRHSDALAAPCPDPQPEYIREARRRRLTATLARRRIITLLRAHVEDMRSSSRCRPPHWTSSTRRGTSRSRSLARSASSASWFGTSDANPPMSLPEAKRAKMALRAGRRPRIGQARDVGATSTCPRRYLQAEECTQYPASLVRGSSKKYTEYRRRPVAAAADADEVATSAAAAGEQCAILEIAG